MIATVEKLRMIVMAGNMSAKMRPTLSVVVVRSMLATSKRFSSYTVRSKARMTRTPLRNSRVTWLMRSIFFCIDMKSGMARVITRPMTTPMTGIATRMTAESGTSRRSAMMRPPMAVIGAATTTLSIISTTIWTCCTSLVVRVMSDGGPNLLTSACEKPWMRRNREPRVSRPRPMEVLDPK